MEQERRFLAIKPINMKEKQEESRAVEKDAYARRHPRHVL